jgi:hypothetical protein
MCTWNVQAVFDRIHPESLERRGHERKPEPKLLPSESRAYRDQGIISPRMQTVLDTRAARLACRADEQDDARTYWDARKTTLGITDSMGPTAQLAAVCLARTQLRDQAPPRTVSAVPEVQASVEVDDRLLGDLAGEAYRAAHDVAQGVWNNAQDAHVLRGIGSDAADDAWRDAVLLWAEEQGARTLRDVGWEALQDAREEGREALAVIAQEEQARAQAQTVRNVEQELQALAQQLDTLHEREGRAGPLRIRLWDREQGMGL